MENVCTILLARLGSSRLPKKHLKEFCGITVIEFLFKRANLLSNWPNFILRFINIKLLFLGAVRMTLLIGLLRLQKFLMPIG